MIKPVALSILGLSSLAFAAGKPSPKELAKQREQAKFLNQSDIPLEKSIKPPKYQKSKNSSREIGEEKEDNSVTIVSKSDKGFLLLKMSVEDTPYFRVQWHPNNTILNGTNPKVHFGVRLFGMIEANAANPITNPSADASSYLFKEFQWTTMKTFSKLDEKTNTTLNAITVEGTSPSYNIESQKPLKIYITGWYSADQVSTSDGIVSPTGIKFSLNVTGGSTNLNDSYWEFVTVLFTNRESSSLLSNISLGDGISSLEWVPKGVFDGVEKDIIRHNSTNITMTPVESGRNGKNEKQLKKQIARRNLTEFNGRDGKLDKRCGHNVVSFKIPTFDHYFYWDPTVSANEDTAISADQSITENFGTKSSAVSILNQKHYAALASALIAGAFIL